MLLEEINQITKNVAPSEPFARARFHVPNHIINQNRHVDVILRRRNEREEARNNNELMNYRHQYGGGGEANLIMIN